MAGLEGKFDAVELAALAGTPELQERANHVKHLDFHSYDEFRLEVFLDINFPQIESVSFDAFPDQDTGPLYEFRAELFKPFLKFTLRRFAFYGGHLPRNVLCELAQSGPLEELLLDNLREPVPYSDFFTFLDWSYNLRRLKSLNLMWGVESLINQRVIQNLASRRGLETLGLGQKLTPQSLFMAAGWYESYDEDISLREVENRACHIEEVYLQRPLAKADDNEEGRIFPDLKDLTCIMDMDTGKMFRILPFFHRLRKLEIYFAATTPPPSAERNLPKLFLQNILFFCSSLESIGLRFSAVTEPIRFGSGSLGIGRDIKLRSTLRRLEISEVHSFHLKDRDILELAKSIERLEVLSLTTLHGPTRDKVVKADDGLTDMSLQTLANYHGRSLKSLELPGIYKLALDEEIVFPVLEDFDLPVAPCDGEGEKEAVDRIAKKLWRLAPMAEYCRGLYSAGLDDFARKVEARLMEYWAEQEENGVPHKLHCHGFDGQGCARGRRKEG